MPLSLCKISKKTIERIQTIDSTPLALNFFRLSSDNRFDVPLDLFDCSKFWKSPQSRSRAMTICHFWAQNSPFTLKKYFSEKTIHIILVYLLAPSTVQNFQKIISTNLEFWWCIIFVPKMTQIPRMKISSNFSLIKFWCTFWPLIVQNLKKNPYSRSRVITICHFWAWKGTFVLKRFFRKTINKIFMYFSAPFIVENF